MNHASGIAKFYCPLSQPNEWTDKPIPVPMAYMTSSIFVITRSDYGSLPKHHQIIVQGSVGLTDMMTSCLNLFNCTSLKCCMNRGGVIFLTFSNVFCFKSLFIKFTEF